jgi:hypothetical protein
MTGNQRTVLLALTTLSSVLCAGTTFAGTKNLTLERSTLSNDADADGGGLWQYEGGTLLSASGATAGTYIVNRRVTTSGTQTFNTAFETMTLFFTPLVAGAVPEVVVVQGAYSYNSGAFVGSVSAASEKYTWIIGADASGTIATGTSNTTLTLAWNGSKHLTIP